MTHPAFPTERRQELDRIRTGALGFGVVCLAVCLLGAFFSPAQFFRAYLAAYLFYLGIPLGCLVILMIYHLTGGAWGFLIRRILEAGMRTLPLMAVLSSLSPSACPTCIPGPTLKLSPKISSSSTSGSTSIRHFSGAGRSSISSSGSRSPSP